MYFAANGVAVTQSYSPQATFPQQGTFPRPFSRVSGFVNATDVVMQILEDNQGWQDDQSQEILLRQGFNSRDLPPFFAVRFRVWPGTVLATSGTIDIAVMSI